MTIPGFAEPKFSVGQTVYWPGYRAEARTQKPCPDCLDTGFWQVETPAGERFQMTCGLCSPFGWKHEITRTLYVPQVDRRTVGSIGWQQEGPVGEYRYMCLETGIGSGSVYDENRLFDNEESALQLARFLAREAQESHDARVKRNEDEQKRKARRKPAKASK